MAAVLAGGRGAVLSHRSAAALWGIGHERATIEVTARGATRRHRPGFTIHSGTALRAEDVTSREGIPCTSLARTLLDTAHVADRRSLTRAIDEAEARREFDLEAVEQLLRRSRGQRGAAALASVLRTYEPAPVTHSVAEERFLALVGRAGLPLPEANVWMPLSRGGGYRADFLWRDRRLIVEIDGRTHHARRRAFVHDRRRDRSLAAAGYRTLRFAAAEILGQPGDVTEELAALLGLR